MKYYITTPELAEGISSIKAKQMGCSGATQFWWGVTHCDNNISYLSFTEEDYKLQNTPATYDMKGKELTPETTQTSKIIYEKGKLVITTDDLVDYAELVRLGIENEILNNEI